MSEVVVSIKAKRQLSLGILARVLKTQELKKLIKQYDEAPRLGRGGRGPRPLTPEDARLFERHLNFKGSMADFARVEKLKPETISSKLYRIAYLLHVKKIQE